jgi:protein-tyrosine-phosphatase/predicted ATP-grasp superfamily ATP-dependent carboligase
LDLAKTASDNAIDLILPCNDLATVGVYNNQAELSKVTKVYAINQRAFDVCFNKAQTTKLARSLGVPVPDEIEVTDSAHIKHLPDWRFPIIVKPASSIDLIRPGERRLVSRVHNPEDLEASIAVALEGGPVLLQKNFAGHGVGVEVLASEGRLLRTFQHVRVHEPPNGGGSSYRKSVPVQPQLLDAASRLAAAMDLTGVAMFEFRINDLTGDWVLIEINGRFWGSLPLAIAAGLDFPTSLAEMLLYNRKVFSNSYKSEVYARNISWDLLWLLENLRADKSDESLLNVPLRKALWELTNLLRGKESIDSFAWDDPAPLFAELKSIGPKALEIARNRISPQNAARRIFKKAAARRASKKALAAHNVLFVCKGNICRSPFAEHLMRGSLDQGSSVSSAGFIPKSHRSSPAQAQAAALRFGVDLSEHRSRVITLDLVENADLIVVFDESNMREMQEKFPKHLKRVVRIADFLMSGIQIEDPWGKSYEHFARCYTSICEAVQCISTQLGKGVIPSENITLGSSELSARTNDQARRKGSTRSLRLADE